ncbi:uncharacterized protein LOC129742757 [Uranotaenia lowii]|uniref:uncharacterized protein LOC129742757 n=1 Tax=Uranotaenia lowii TaxID=190385 RepID=UPI0024787F77|nr:uncharacterized protein LOC129742757 [Uranotaenia lowii]
MTDDIRRLSKKEQILWNLLENLEDFLQDYEDDSDYGSLQPRLAKLDEAYERFCDLRVQIEVIMEDVNAEDDSVDDAAKKQTWKMENKTVYKDFVNRYFSLKQQMLSKIQSIPAQPTNLGPFVSDPVLPCHTKYPELTLPTFSGELSDWINFRDNFKSLIHDNAQLNDMDKFNYLRTSLKGDAILQINQIQVAAINYSLAWSTLQAKYENHKLIAREHMKALFEAPIMPTECFEALNVLISTFKINLQQLEKLGQKTSSWSTLLAFMLSQKLDPVTYRLWETHHGSKDVPSYESMIVFLENQCSILQSTASRNGNDDHRSYRAPISHSTVTMERFCPVCRSGSHKTEQCAKFYRMRVIDRKDLVRRLRLCFNCLDSGHFVENCSCCSCSKCGQRHHVLLHPYSPNQDSQSNLQFYSRSPRRPQRAISQSRSEPETLQNQAQTNSFQSTENNSQTTLQPPPTNTPTVSHHTTLLSTQRNTHTAMLSTAVVMLADSSGNTVLARALLDNGSQISMMTENLSQKLKFQRIRENLPVNGVGGSSSISKEAVFARIISCTSAFTTGERKFFVLPQITLDLPQRSVDTRTWKIPPSISLADPDFNKSGPIDLVLGVSTFYEVLLPHQMRIDEGNIDLEASTFMENSPITNSPSQPE